MTEGRKKYALAYRAKLEALRVRDFARVQQEEAYMRKIASSYGLSFAETRKIKDEVEGKTMQSNPVEPEDRWWEVQEHKIPEAAPSGGSGAGLLAVGVLALIGGVIYVATRPDAPSKGGELPAPAPAPPGKPKCLDCAPSPTGDMTEIESFAKASGYNIWCVEKQAVSTWQPAKGTYTSDPKARAYSQLDCSFYKWTGTNWAVDEGTNTDLKNWRAQFIGVSGHPVSAFVLGA